MEDPVLGTPLPCPACAAPLRDFHGRLCCDACNGMLLEADDLANAIARDSGIATPSLQFRDGATGKRACPRCRAAMITCHVDVFLDEQRAKPRPKLDRCNAHGVWFDADELAKVFAAVLRASEPPSHASLRDYIEGGIFMVRNSC